jgi:hypothetical protein
MVGFAATVGVHFMLLRRRPRRTAAGIPINTRFAWHVVSGGATKSIVLENRNATRRPPLRLLSAPEDRPDLIEGQERRVRCALTGAAVGYEAVTERLNSIRWAMHVNSWVATIAFYR